jgi:ectoine hydroxylase-related dioxygenase (phytanoyl-CoA dioxygenase family)
MNYEELNKKGFTILREWVTKPWLNNIQNILPLIFDQHRIIREQNNNSIISNGVAMNVLVSDNIFVNFLETMIERGLINDIQNYYFKDDCILNSFSAISNIPSESTLFYKKVHRDIRKYSGNIPLLLNMLVMVDDFTIDNGSTLLLPGSHLKEETPTTEYWENNSISMTGKAGDIIIWNSNIFHASGINKTNNIRRALPITFSLPYYKQLLDYPRALGYDKKDMYSKELQALIGYNSRVPSSLNEWYAPNLKRMYK